MVAEGEGEDTLRLITVIDRQQHELDRIRAGAAGESLVAMARGALMERLGLSSAEAASQLAELSAATGIPSAEMAAAVLSDSGEAGAVGRDAAQADGSPSPTAGSGPAC
ncbi:MAG: ANTAR domain-containing protein [Streptosporangiaceae bacterium]